MSHVFEVYGHYYDLLYGDKDYAAETDYVVGCIREQLPNAKTILELGCGTGAHAEQLARQGFTVHGFDMSDSMLTRAQARKASLPEELQERLCFEHGDARDVRTGNRYDVVISLFHVVSYQTSDADLEKLMTTAARHLPSKGLFLFDFWYGPAVIAQVPDMRVKRLEDAAIKVTRIAEPEVFGEDCVVDVNYDIFVEQKDSGAIKQIQEKHRMRYIFPSELASLLDIDTWSNFKLSEWLSADAPTDDSWSAFVAARRK